jgi:hypothetical protein
MEILHNTQSLSIPVLQAPTTSRNSASLELKLQCIMVVSPNKLYEVFNRKRY